MEELLDVKHCIRCGAAFAFRLSRFGCVFVCPCGECIDAVRAAAHYADSLHVRHSPSCEPVPSLSSPVCDLTASLRVAEVEINFTTNECVVQLKNFAAVEVSQLAGSLSNAVAEQVRLEEATLTAPLTLLDAVVEELRSAAEDPHLHFFVNTPAPHLRGAVQAIANSGLPQSLLQNIPVGLFQILKKHQVDGVKRALQLGGRMLFADDMGVGKTLATVATVAALRAYPLLIVCPSAIKFMWADQIEQFLHEQVAVDEMCIISGANDALRHGTQPKVVLISYHMAAVLESQLLRREWACVVCDESHLLHTNTSGADAMYTQAVAAIAKKARHCLLLSGTPALSSPFDMFNQLDVLRPGLLGATRFHFAMRYCHIHFTPYLRVGGSTRQVELASVLSACYMIRRLKRDVLELPAKSRVVLRVADRAVNKARQSASKSASYQERYASSWRANWSGIVEVVDYCCAKYPQVVLLAHHIELIDALERLLLRRGKAVVRIDGRVPPQQRGALLAKFHAEEAAVAVVGITACAVGISLAPAPCAVFCELPPDAVWMTQAEDRLHRPGQTGEVVVYYLLGVHSEVDAELFARLSRSMRAVGGVVSQSDGGDLTLSQATHQAGDCLDALVQLPAPPAQARHPVQLTEEPLLFYVSRNTGRIHVRARDAAVLYVTFLWNEANDCVRQRQSPIWKQLDTFLTTFASHTPFQQRQIYLSRAWLPAAFRWDAKTHRATQDKRTRYAKASMLGWGIWWEVRRQYFSNYYYFGPLVLVNERFVVCCLNCRIATLDFAATGSANGETLFPGKVCSVKTDTELFCGGQCREAFYFRRSSASIRRTVVSVDKSICAHCHVDCEALCTALAAASPRKERLAVLSKLHPQLLHYPNLYERMVAHPDAGNVWHADHIQPVAAGGGEAGLENVQTLCVLCHALKTKEDVKRIKQHNTQSPPPSLMPATTVDCALLRLRTRQETRVSRRL